MKEKMLKTFASLKSKRGLVLSVLTLSILLVTCMFPAFATGASAVGVLIGYILKIFQYLGALLLIWAIAQLVLAFKNEDADSKSRAMMMMMVALILVVLKPVVQAVLNAAGLTSITITDAKDF